MVDPRFFAMLFTRMATLRNKHSLMNFSEYSNYLKYYKQKWDTRWYVGKTYNINPRPDGVWLLTRPAGGGGRSKAPRDLPNYWTDFQISNTIGLACTWTTRTRWKIWTGRHQWSHRSCQSKNARLFKLDELGEENIDVKHKQSQLIGMDSVTVTCKYEYQCFMTIIQVKVTSGHLVKNVKQKKSGYGTAIHVATAIRFCENLTFFDPLWPQIWLDKKMIWLFFVELAAACPTPFTACRYLS